MKYLNFLFAWLKKAWFSAIQNARESEIQFIPLGIIGFIGFGIYYFIWHDVEVTSYESMPLRLIAMLLCLGLIVKNYWPKKLRQFLPIYWYLTLLYIMPFFFTFMLLKNNFSEVWILNSMTALFYVILLLDWISSLLLLALGIGLAWLCYILTSHAVSPPPGLVGIIFAYLSVIGVGELLAYNKQEIQKEKLKNMHSVGASIAHELRTPLRTINTGITSIQRCLPTLLNCYQTINQPAISQEPSSVANPNKKLIEELPTIAKNVETETQASFLLIDMLLINLKHLEARSYSTELVSIADCINEALERYPFDAEERELVVWKNGQDFTFCGNKLLMVHVLFNLLKNALYYIRVAGKGNISIWLDHDMDGKKLHFKDTGLGINKAMLPYIFDRFFTQTLHGSGIGLAFCKAVMQAIDGKIECYSQEGQYTEFVLTFKQQDVEVIK